jgi:hypothetical protein
MRLRVLVGVMLTFATIMACGPVYRTVRPTDAELKPIRSIGVVIPKEGEATVIFERARATAGPAFMFGLVGATIASAGNATMDSNKAKTVRPLLKDFSCRTVLFNAFQRALSASGRFAEIRLLDKAPDAKAGDAPDGVVTLAIHDWGLRLMQQDSEQLSAFVEIEADLRGIREQRWLWDEHDSFLSGRAHNLSEYQGDGALLKAELTDAIERAGGELAGQLAYPTGGSK